MRYKRAYIDSLNLSGENLEAMFIYNEDYYIEVVKNKSVFEPNKWKETFGKKLTPSIIDARIVHTCLGLKLPLKTFAITPKRQTLEFAGLHGYNERSQLLMQTLNELKSWLLFTWVTRGDIAIDYIGMIPKKIIKRLSQTRKPKQVGHTTYWKTDKEKKTNRVMDIKIYSKTAKEKLDYPLMRLEFVFKSEYLKKLYFKDLQTIFKKMEKTIKRATGLNVKIQGIGSLACTRVS
ncbi:MAG: hypothetical protein QG567_665 [Campylobacterota bacterium]|jgi:hypothetical protein|nr:hypothetical protein [Campylobacterota bacterium]